MEQEEWRAIPGWEGLYEVSSHGRVRSLDRTVRMLGRWGYYDRFIDGKILRQSHGNGLRTYRAVGLNRDGKGERDTVHRMVCKAFHGPQPSPKHVVAHYDGNPLNNHADNLRWATYVENASDCARHGRNRLGTKNGYVKLTDEQVRQIRAAEGTRQRDLAQQFGISQFAVWRIRSGKGWKHIR